MPAWICKILLCAGKLIATARVLMDSRVRQAISDNGTAEQVVAVLERSQKELEDLLPDV